MSNTPMNEHERSTGRGTERSFWLTPNGLAALGLIGAVLYFLLTEHRAHFIYVLPYLILLLCPVMHMLMHGGHGGHGSHGGDGQSRRRDREGG